MTYPSRVHRAQGTGERVARRFFELCESPRTGPRMMRVLNRSADSAVGGRLLVAVLSRVVFTPMLRYVTRMEPVASLPLEELVQLVAPGLQATLDA